MADEFGIRGDDVADALFEGMDLSHLSQAVVLGSLIESPENIREMIADHEFPMSRDKVVALFYELKEDGLMSEEFMIQDLPDKEYSNEQVIEILNGIFIRMLEHGVSS